MYVVVVVVVDAALGAFDVVTLKAGVIATFPLRSRFLVNGGTPAGLAIGSSSELNSSFHLLWRGGFETEELVFVPRLLEFLWQLPSAMIDWLVFFFSN